MVTLAKHNLNTRPTKKKNEKSKTKQAMQYMKPAFRNAASYCHAFSRSLALNPNPLILVYPFRRPETFCLVPPVSCFSSSMAMPPSSLEKQFDAFRVQLEESGTLRDRIRSVVSEIESSNRLIYATLLLVHQSRPTPGSAKHTMLHYYPSYLNPNHTLSLFFFFKEKMCSFGFICLVLVDCKWVCFLRLEC